MKAAVSLLSRLFLIVCLAAYGQLGMAATDGNGGFLMEICADGVAKTVRVDAEGDPVEPAETCRDCLTCCQATGAAPGVPFGVDVSMLRLPRVADPVVLPEITSRKPTIRLMLRGPPVEHSFMQTTPDLFVTERAKSGHDMRSDGRPFFKDAIA
ncbi:hypothetical protein ACEWPJ_16575 [Aliiroseovarius sp. YM-037]